MFSLSTIIDQREQYLKNYLSQDDILNYNILFGNLEIGDIQIILVEKNISSSTEQKYNFIFERKTIQDLIASISDGRYKNQKIKLLEERNKQQNTERSNKIFYILEGDITYTTTTYGVYLNTIIRDNIPIFLTKDIEDTYNLVLNILERMKKQPEKYISIASKDYVVSSSSSKNNNIYKNILQQIPGVSSKTADGIIKEYPSLKDFMSITYNSLEKLKINNRKISSKVINNIIGLLNGDTTTSAASI